MQNADIGIIGLAVMGKNLTLNLLDHGLRVAVFNRETEWARAFVEGPGRGRDVVAAASLKALVDSLAPPRKVMLLIRAGSAVDEVLEALVPLLAQGDIVIDGGNANFHDTIRRCASLEARGLLYVGCGVSGGAEGARRGPSLMPGGSPAAWPHIRGILQAVAAHVGGEPCCEWVGEGGAGHFVKMVHNGIEYGDMQVICEAYHLMRSLLGMTPAQAGDTFARWQGGPLDSYLVGITAKILRTADADGAPLVDRILDAAGQKGTGKWTGIEALEAGVPLTLIGEAVFARCLSAMKDERLRASAALPGPGASFSGDARAFLEALERALYAAKIISYAQGYMLMRAAAGTYGWKLNYGGIARIWRGGCIIRSAFLEKIREAYARDPALENLLLDPYFAERVGACQQGLRTVCARAAENGVPVPALAGALSFYDGYRAARLPANLLQAQRDYFGAHGYERVDAPRGVFFHTDWTGAGTPAP